MVRGNLKNIHYFELLIKMSKNLKNVGGSIPNNNNTLSNIYFPESKNHLKEGYLVGYRFEKNQFVVSTIVDTDQVSGVEELSRIIKTT